MNWQLHNRLYGNYQELFRNVRLSQTTDALQLLWHVLSEPTLIAWSSLAIPALQQC